MNGKWLALLLSLIILLCGCSEVVHGHVEKKWREPEFFILMPMTTSTGKSTMTFFVPIIFPETWAMEVSGPDKNGQNVEQVIYLNRNDFDSINVGDIYECGGKQEKECVTDRPHHEK